MSHILVASTPADGHAKPMLTIAAHLKRSGHQVTFNTGESYRSQAETLGLNFIPTFGKASQEAFDQALIDRQKKLTGDQIELKRLPLHPINNSFYGIERRNGSTRRIVPFRCNCLH